MQQVSCCTPGFPLGWGGGVGRNRAVGLDKLPYWGYGGSSVLCQWMAAVSGLWEGIR